MIAQVNAFGSANSVRSHGSEREGTAVAEIVCLPCREAPPIVISLSSDTEDEGDGSSGTIPSEAVGREHRGALYLAALTLCGVTYPLVVASGCSYITFSFSTNRAALLAASSSVSSLFSARNTAPVMHSRVPAGPLLDRRLIIGGDAPQAEGSGGGAGAIPFVTPRSTILV